MSELSERVAREHRFGYLTWVGDAEVEMEVCTCHARTEGTHGEHLAEVTEAAVRETIAADIEAASARRDRDNEFAIIWASAYSISARIARGES